MEIMNNDDMLNAKLKTLDEYKIITLCGSTKFKKSFEILNCILTLNNKIILMPGCFMHNDKINITDEQKVKLDILHKQKIDMSECIIVVNENNYIGDSTKSEIIYTSELNKPIYYMYDNQNQLNNEIFD
jgi:precorrin-3B methylase